jgi:hypothetical protein
VSRFALMAVLLFVLNPPEDLDQLARRGSIQENAPVKASVETTINAAPEKVWGLLTDVKNWPTWHPGITKADISGPIQNGTAFTWTSGAEIHSQIALVRPVQELAWTGTAFGAKAIHVWTLQRLTGERTLVKTTESMDGFLLTLFYSSKKLQESDQRWLNDLKAAAER